MEKNRALSDCRIWSDSKEYYRSQGNAAWQNIPYLATNNPSIAKSYAKIIWSYWEELFVKHGAEYVEPFYILELGAGTGMFGFYLLKQLFELSTAIERTEIPFVYIMSDCAEKNVAFWRQHPALQLYSQSGHLEFAVYDPLCDDQLTTENSGLKISFDRSSTRKQPPLVVVANYVFDSLPQDVFRVVNGQIEVGTIDPNLQFNPAADNQPIDLHQVDPQFCYRSFDWPYYPHQELDHLLKDYATKIEHGYFSVPLGTLESIDKLLKLADREMLLIATDKGVGRHAGLYRNTKPDLVFHDGAVSMSVNFDMLGVYLESRGGRSFQQSTRQGIVTSVFLLGQDNDCLPKTAHACLSQLCQGGPGDLLNLYQHFLQTKSTCNLGLLVSYLNLFDWSPQVLSNSFPEIMSQLENPENAIAVQDLLEHLPLVSANFFYLPFGHDILAKIAMIYQRLRFFQPALCYYESSIEYFGKSANLLFNIGICNHFLKDDYQAMQAFQETLRLDPNHLLAKEWLAQIDDGQHFPTH